MTKKVSKAQANKQSEVSTETQEAQVTAAPKPEAKKGPTRAQKSQWKVDLKKALFANPKVTDAELMKLVVKEGYPSLASVSYARAETLHTLAVLRDAKLYSHPNI